MKLQKAEELMSLLALISVLMLVMTIALTSPSSPWPLTVSRMPPASQQGAAAVTQQPVQNTGQTRQPASSAPQTEAQQTAPESNPFPMEINQADKQSLMEVEGIGEIKAQRILDYREQVGRIERMEQLLEVEGIGEVTLERLCELFYVAQ